ncbi:MAG TPA: hypothetical protein VLQ93_19480 [Myxococcaceae bacterium]|nr:hypothetical protein [Myxococcaceae bacterium]
MRRLFHALLLAAVVPLGLSCDSKLELPQLPEVDFSKVRLPKLDTGNLVLIETGEGRLQLDPRGNDALTALGACTDLITYCFEPGKRSLDVCVEGVPQCNTSRPWQEDACCPKSCMDGYAKARDKGQEPISAFETVFFLQPDCFPGVRELLEVK